MIADNRYIAEDACDLVEVDFDVKTPVVDYEKAAADTENIVHKEWGTNVGMHIPAFGLGYDAPELQAIFDSAAHVTEQTIRQSRSSNVPMETRGISASWNPYDESLEVRVSTQNQSDYRAVFSRFLDVPEHKIRVVKKDVGGAFGQKGITSREDLLRRAVDVPPRPAGEVDRGPPREPHRVEPRAHRAGQGQDGVRRRGPHPRDGDRLPRRHRRLPARRADVDGRDDLHDGAGRVQDPGGRVLVDDGVHEHVRPRRRTAARGSSRPRSARSCSTSAPARWASTRSRSAAATCSPTAELPYTSATGTTFDGGVAGRDARAGGRDPRLRAGARRAGRRAREEGRLVGVGIALYVEPTGMAALNMSTEGATLRVEPDGHGHRVGGLVQPRPGPRDHDPAGRRRHARRRHRRRRAHRG